MCKAVGKLRYIAVGMLCLLSLTGCHKKTLEQICRDNPQVCRDLDLDAVCKERRKPLLELRLAIKARQIPANDETQFKVLQAVTDYHSCLARAASIQHVNNPSLTRHAQKAYALISQTLANLEHQTQGSHNAHLAYYHWTKLGDKRALSQLNALEQQDKIDDAYILAGLATARLKTAPQQARKLYLEALSHATPDEFAADWLLALASVTPDAELKYLLQKTDVIMTSRGVNQRMLTNVLGDHKAQQAELDKQAELLAQALQQGQYQQSQWPKRLAAPTDDAAVDNDEADANNTVSASSHSAS